MEVHQESPVLTYVVKQFFDHFAQKAHDNNKFSIDLTNITGTYLQDINDDCLLEIFSIESLSLMDFCSIAETCKRFQQITQRVFPKKISVEYANNGTYNVKSRKYLPSENRPLHDIKRILKNFGSFLTVMSISILRLPSDMWGWDYLSKKEEKDQDAASHFMLYLVARYCADTLKGLKINNLRILKVDLKRLQYLEIKNGIIMGDNNLFADFDSLRELRVTYVENYSSILDNVFPKLKRFTYEGNDSPIDSLNLSTFISRHESLKSVHIDIWGENCKKIIMQAVVNSCTKMKDLSISMGLSNTDASLQLQRLKSLVSLQLKQVTCERFEFVSALTKLRELHLYYCNIPKDSNQFTFLSQLTHLYIYFESNTFIDVVEIIIKRLINLEELAISEVWLLPKIFVLDEKTYSKIVSIVKERPKMLTIKYKFNFNLKNFDENKKVRILPLD